MQLNQCVLGAEPVVSDAMEDGDRIPMTTFAPSWGRLRVLRVAEVCVSRGGAYGSSNQSVLRHRRVPPERGMVYTWVVYTRWESFGVLRVTGSLLHVVLSCLLAVWRACSSRDSLQVPRFSTDLWFQFVWVDGDIHRTIL